MSETRTTEAGTTLDPALSTPIAVGSALVPRTGEVRSEPPAPHHSMAEFLGTVNLDNELAAAKAMADAYNAACRALLGDDDVQEDGGRTFKKKSAWRKLARHFKVSTRIVSETAFELWNGDYTLVDGESAEVLQEGRTELIAKVVVEAYAPWGQRMEAVGVCSTHEKRFHWPNGFQKRWADCIATAETRATNRAVSNLIAAGEVSAEEIEGADASATASAGRAPGQRPNLPKCPKCGKGMYDNRKENDKREAAGERLRPDYKCKDRGCEGLYWRGQWPPKPKDDAPDPQNSATGASASPQGVPSAAAASTTTTTSTSPTSTATTDRLTFSTPMPFGPEGMLGATLVSMTPAQLEWLARNYKRVVPPAWQALVEDAVIMGVPAVAARLWGDEFVAMAQEEARNGERTYQRTGGAQ